MHYRQAGFSLIELCITVAIAALIMTIGIPSFQSLSSENHASAHLDELNSALRLARQLSVEHNRLAKLCARTPSTDPTATPTCDTTVSADWANGWIVMLQDGSGTYQDIMTNPHALDETAWIVKKTGTTTELDSVIFGPTGTLRSPTPPAVTIQIGLAGCTKITEVALSGQLSYNAFGCDP